jgi:hypothetical protein
MEGYTLSSIVAITGEPFHYLLHHYPNMICFYTSSCGPNAAIQWSLPTLSASLYALRPIQSGEEILKTYIDPVLPRATRVATPIVTFVETVYDNQILGGNDLRSRWYRLERFDKERINLGLNSFLEDSGIPNTRKTLPRSPGPSST